MIGYTLKTRLSPLVFLAVLIKVSLLASLIFLGLVPYRTVTHLKEKQAIVIFLNKIAQLGRASLHGRCQAVHNLSRSHLCPIQTGQRVYPLVNDSIFETTTLYKREDAGTQRVVGEAHALIFEQHDMPSSRRFKGTAHLARLQSVNPILKFLEGLAVFYPGQFATLLGRPLIIRASAGRLGKISPTLQGLVDRVYTQLSLTQLVRRSFLAHHHQDVGRLDQATRAVHPGTVVGIYLTCLCLHVVLGYQRRTYLLVAVSSKLLFK